MSYYKHHRRIGGRDAFLKEKSATAYSATQRKIDQAEQDLWVLTFDVAPDVGKVDVAIRSIALLAAEQRTESMRAVSEATGVLSGAQRKAAFTRNALAPGRKEGM